MLRALRQCHALALGLLLAAPGLGGTWLSVGHPCPVDAAASAVEQHRHTPEQPSEHRDHEQCTCLGSCQVQNVTRPVRTVELALAASGFEAVRIQTGPASPSSDRRWSHLHPPSTAPPQTS